MLAKENYVSHNGDVTILWTTRVILLQSIVQSIILPLHASSRTKFLFVIMRRRRRREEKVEELTRRKTFFFHLTKVKFSFNENCPQNWRRNGEETEKVLALICNEKLLLHISKSLKLNVSNDGGCHFPSPFNLPLLGPSSFIVSSDVCFRQNIIVALIFVIFPPLLFHHESSFFPSLALLPVDVAISIVAAVLWSFLIRTNYLIKEKHNFPRQKNKERNPIASNKHKGFINTASAESFTRTSLEFVLSQQHLLLMMMSKLMLR